MKEEMEKERLELHRMKRACERELSYRQRCYPRWVKEGRMKEKMAYEEIQIVKDMLAYFKREIAKREPELPGLQPR